MSTRFKFTIEFECDKDGVKGWGNQVEDWIALATERFMRQSHYHTRAKVISSEEIKPTIGK
jgi:hypothetical protein